MARGPEQILDEYLVVLAPAGSGEALGQLAARWSPRLLRYAARTLGSADGAEDVVQEAWSSALRTLPRLQDPANFPAWIYAIATRKCADAIRARRRGRRLEDRLRTDAPLNGHAVEALREGGGSIDLAAALRRLPPGQRIVVGLHYGEDLPVDDVAAVLGIPPGTVKSRLHAARETLKVLMEGQPQ